MLDQIKDYHRLLIENAQYRSLLQAVEDKHAVEGSLAIDSYMAATMIREAAQQRSDELAKLKLAIIATALFDDVLHREDRIRAMIEGAAEAQAERLARHGISSQ